MTKLCLCSTETVRVPATLNIIPIVPKLRTLSAEKRKMNPITYRPLSNNIKELL